MALTKAEYKELKELHSLISHAECFGTRDLLRETQLLNKATESQASKICKCCY